MGTIVPIFPARLMAHSVFTQQEETGRGNDMSSEAVMSPSSVVGNWIMPDVVADITSTSFFKRADSQASSAHPLHMEMQLPYPESALEPYLSAKAIRRHCGDHAAFYADQVISRVAGTAYADRTVEDILRGGALRNDVQLVRCACHIHNHNVYWRSMKPGGGGKPGGRLMRLLTESFGSWDEFLAVFRSRAGNRLWAGWLWLVQDGPRVLLTHATHATSPLLEGQKPLLALDLWEYAYVIDYGNNRDQYVETFLKHLVDWDAVEKRLG